MLLQVRLDCRKAHAPRGEPDESVNRKCGRPPDHHRWPVPQMRRREFVLLLGGVMTAARCLRAQQKAMPVIGFLHSGSPSPFAPFVAAFHQGLSETGYIEGQSV